MNGHDMIGAPRREAVQPPPTGIDPLRYCVMTTVAILTWAAGPAVVAAVGALGFAAYWRATRSGLKQSRCVLRYPSLVMSYLAIAVGIAVLALARTG